MLGLAGVPSVIMFIGFLFMPESPRWLVFHGKTDKALAVLSKLRDPSEVHKELKSINEDFENHKKQKLGIMGVVFRRRGIIIITVRLFEVATEIRYLKDSVASTVCWVWSSDVPTVRRNQHSNVCLSS